MSGWEKVFSFSFIQTVKSKSFIVSTLLMFVIMAGGTAYMTLSGADDSMGGAGMDVVNISKAYVYDEMGITDNKLKDALLGKSKVYEESKFVYITENIDDVNEKLESFEDADDSVMIHLFSEDNMIKADVIRTKDSNINDMNAGLFEDDLYDVVGQMLYTTAGITEEQIEFLSDEVKTKVTKVDKESKAEENKEQTDNFMAGSAAGMALFMIVLIVLAMGGENASSSMVIEKGSKVIEYILTSVRPLAFITGKVMASVAALLTQIVVIVAGVAASVLFITNGTSKDIQVSDIVESVGISKMADNINALNLTLAIAVMIAGIVFYILIAALIGSTASKMEELGQKNVFYSMLLIVGAYTAMVLTMTNFEEGSMAQNFILAFPLSSPFVAPTFLVSGDCSIAVGVVSLICELVAVGLMILLVAKTFESVIMYTGSKMTMKAFLEIAGIKKTDKKAADKSDDKKGGAGIE